MINLLTYTTFDYSSIKRALGEDEEFTIWSFIYNSTIMELADKLSIFVSDDWKQFVKNKIIEKLNDKAEFRNIAKKQNVPHAVGVLCESEDFLSETIHHYLNSTGKIIIKQPRSSGTMGNIGISNYEYAFIGVHKTYLANECNIKEISQEIWSKYINNNNNQLIVEVYYPHTQTITAILNIDENKKIHLVNTGVIYFPEVSANQSALNPFTGVDGMQMPAIDINNKLLLSLINYSYLLAQYVKDAGYHGLLSVDAIITDNQEVIFTEVNVRNGGETHINYLINKLFDKSELPFYNASVIESSIQGFNLSVEETLQILNDHQLLFDKNHGVIILSLNSDTQRLEYLILSQDEKYLSKLQQNFLKIVALQCKVA